METPLKIYKIKVTYMKDWILELLRDISSLAYDSWSSPEAVSTAIIAIIGAISGAIVAIIGAFRAIDRKAGKECCRFTKKPLNPKQEDKKEEFKEDTPKKK